MKFKHWLTEEYLSYTPNVIYIGAILTRDAQRKLFESVNKIVPIPQEWKRLCHHMTIRFKPTDASQYPTFGESVSLIVTDLAANEKCVAVKVEPNTHKEQLKMPPEQLPHITVATAPGVSPVYSNEILRGVTQKMPQTLVLEAFIGAKLKHGIAPERKDAAYESF